MILNRDRLAMLTDQWGRFRSLSLASPITPTVGPGDDGFLWLDIGVDGTPVSPIWKMWDEEAATWRQIASPAAWDVITGKPATFDPTLANPSAVVGLAAVNGAATTAIRSDGAPALNQAIAPTWTGAHVFKKTADSVTGWQIQDQDGNVILNVDSVSNRVGIKTAAPGADLHINTAAAPGLIIERTTGANANMQFKNADDAVGFYVGMSGQEKFGIGRNVDLGTDNLLTIDNTGNVGIGTTAPGFVTTAGRRYLTVIGSTRAGVLEFETMEADAANNVVGIIQWSDINSTAAAANKRVAAIAGFLDGATANLRGGSIAFYTRANNSDADLSERMRVDNAGNVGIAQGSPSTLFEILAADNVTTMTVKVNANQAAANGTILDIRSTTGSEGTIVLAAGGAVTYNAFIGSHFTQVVDKMGLEINMLLEVVDETPVWEPVLREAEKTEEITDRDSKTTRVVTPAKYDQASPKERLFKTRVCATRGSKAAVGVYGGTDNFGRDMVFSLGAGFIIVANKGKDIVVGDYLVASDVRGCAELQDDDVYRSNTVAKATQAIKWEIGEVKRTIKCIYLGG